MRDESQKIRLHRLTVDEAQALVRREQTQGLDWAPGFPTSEQVAFIRAFVRDATNDRDPGPFGLYLLVVDDAKLVVGGAGFVGPPDASGAVEIVFDLAPSERKLGYGREAIAAIVDVARTNGALTVTTAAPLSNRAVQRAIERGGLREVDRDEWVVHYAVDLTA